MAWLPEPSLLSPLITIRNFIGAGTEYPGWKTISVGIAFFTVGTMAYVKWKGEDKWLTTVKEITIRRWLTGNESEILLVLCWLLLPILLPLILSEIFGPVYYHRYMIGSSGAFYILLAFVITKLGKVVPEVISIGAMAIIIAPGLYQFYVSPVKEQWREAAAYVEENVKKDDVLLFTDRGSDQNFKNFDWYYSGNLKECIIDISTRLKGDEEIRDAVEECTSGNDRFWLIMQEEPDSIEEFMKTYFENNKHIHLIERRDFRHLYVFLFRVNK
jgi:hypothetical protein